MAEELASLPVAPQKGSLKKEAKPQARQRR
jgi:hypothetical protein